nr:helix-turn-helix domain-containing protein [Pseudomonas sp. SWRI 103]
MSLTVADVLALTSLESMRLRAGETGPSLRHDAHHGPSLMPTVEAWFHENGNLVAAAQRLAVYRNTLTHRVQRIEALYGLTLDNAYDRLDIGIAPMIWRLSA